MQHLPIDKNKVQALIKQCKHLNIFPVFFERYYPKTDSNPVSLLLAELIDESVQYLKIMTAEEIDLFVDSFPPAIKMFVDLRATTAPNEALYERIALKYLVAVVHAGYISYKKIVSSNITESEVIKIYPELLDLIDDDGLLYIDERFGLLDGGVEYKDHILHYHQFLRRGYGSNPNFDFLNRFIRFYYKTRPDNTFRIAIDHHRIMPKEFFQRIVEMDTWYGPKFDKSKLDDINTTGLTVVKRSQPSPFDFFFGKLDRTEFFWSYRDGVKTFEVEEISGKELFYDPYYLNKYVHSERDVSLKLLRHFDGAVKVYLQENYDNRLISQMPKEFKSYKKIKLFRIDGDIDIDEWIELIALFYKGNEMIIEYFNPEQFEQMFGENIRKYKEFKKEQEAAEDV
jgi:hypothetical protein